MAAYTHTIGPASLDRVCFVRDLPSEWAEELAKSIGTALARFEPGIGEYASAHFVAQCAHESGEFRFARELWGPTAAQKRYWSRRDIQGDGPLWPGLGYATRGGGWIQTTGRANYRTAAKRLRVPGTSYLWLAARAGQLYYASALAAVWWADHFPRDMSGDEWTVDRVTRIVNGGYNGLDARRRYTDRAMDVRQFLNPEPL
jgi:putative chitinase